MLKKGIICVRVKTFNKSLFKFDLIEFNLPFCHCNLFEEVKLTLCYDGGFIFRDDFFVTVAIGCFPRRNELLFLNGWLFDGVVIFVSVWTGCCHLRDWLLSLKAREVIVFVSVRTNCSLSGRVIVTVGMCCFN